MSRLGSGQRPRAAPTTTVEDCLQLDVNRWAREGWLRGCGAFTWTWSTPEGVLLAMTVITMPNVVLLQHAWPGAGPDRDPVCYPVRLTWTRCNFGGARAWFICPGVVNEVPCGRRVAKLYLGGRYFLCRHCYGLAYTSQRLSPARRALAKAQAIRRRLGGSDFLGDPFPVKPPYMHWLTYLRLREAAARAEETSLASMAAWERRFEKALVRLGCVDATTDHSEAGALA